jgi:peptidoglycan/xylan/chitin deacetylase (PgdA/CDA1 family)
LDETVRDRGTLSKRDEKGFDFAVEYATKMVVVKAKKNKKIILGKQMSKFHKKKRSIVIALLRFLFFYSGLAFLLSLIRRDTAIILMYHSINDPSVNLIYTPNIVSLENFEKQVMYLASKKRVISLEELVTNIQKGIKFPKGCVVITFDDGYKDNYTNAYPILKEYNLPATFFLATDYIGSNKMKWDDELNYKIKQSNCESVVLKIKNKLKKYNLRKKKEKRRMINDLIKLIVNSSEEKRKKFICEFDNKLKININKQDIKSIMLSWEDIRAKVRENNISFGAHTCSHSKLTNVSLEDARKEIVGGKHKIENEIGKKISFFSYPYGDRSYKRNT